MSDRKFPEGSALSRIVRFVPALMLCVVGLALVVSAWSGGGFGKTWQEFQNARGEGPPLSTWEKAACVGKFAGGISALACAALMLVLGFFLRGSPQGKLLREESVEGFRPWRMPVLLYWGLVLAVVVWGAALRLPLLKGGMWWDELWNVKQTVVGEFRPDKKNPGALRWVETSWERCAWYYNKPANHPPISLAAKGCHELWKNTTKAKPGEFSEWVLRLPVFLIGLATIALAAGMLRGWGCDAAGLGAAVLVAVHPWLVRYGADMRSYGVLPFLTLLATFFLTKATRPGAGGRHWILFGLCEFLLMWCHPISAWICLALCAASLVLILRARTGIANHRRRALGEWMHGQIFAAGLFLAAFLPNLAQALVWKQRNADGNLLTGDYLASTGTQALFGMEWKSGGGQDGEGIVSFSDLTSQPLWAGALVLAAFALLVFFGLQLLRQQNRRAACIYGSILGALALFMGVVYASHFYFYHRFIIGVAGILIILAALGCECLGRWMSDRAPVSLRRVLLFLPAVALLAGYLWATHSQRVLLATRDYAGYRAARDFLVAEQKKHAQPMRVVSLGHGTGEMMSAYFPGTMELTRDDPDELEKAFADARANGQPIFLLYDHQPLNHSLLPATFKLLEESSQISANMSALFRGIERDFTLRIFQIDYHP